MNIKQLFSLNTLAAVSVSCLLLSNVMAQAKGSESFASIAYDYEQQYFDRFPEDGMKWGKVDVALDRFTDNSLASLKQWEQTEDDFLERLSHVDQASISQPLEKLSYDLLVSVLQNNQASRICRTELWDINPLTGFHAVLAYLADKQPVDTAEHRRLALTRWNTVPIVVVQQIANLKLGLQQHYSAPKPVVDRVLKQIHMMIDIPVEESPFYRLALNTSDEGFRQKISKLIATGINPSLQIYATYLEKTYLPNARDEVGVWALPNGQACYLAKIKQQTTLSKTPEEIFDLGNRLNDSLSHEVGTIGMRLFGVSEPREVFAKAKQSSIGDFSSESDVLAYDEEALDRVKATVNQYFDLMPKTEGTIKPYPFYMAKNGSPGEYWPPSTDGSTPGQFFINTYQPEKMSRVDLEATLFHELIPGHHFQIALTYENAALPSVNKYLWNSGFGEGWALYVERLADSMGLYRDDVSRLGMLSNESMRASRLVVDSGMHAFHWTRQQAVDYLRAHTSVPEHIIQGEVDRYIMLPAQATSYMLGKLQIERLRDYAQSCLGEKFNLREFHNQVLKHGNVSLEQLERLIQQWVDEQYAR